MSFTKKLALSVIFAALILGVACGPTYVVQPTGQQQAVYNPGYDPNQFMYDMMLADVMVNGVHGYYGAGHVFYPMVTVGGVGGYYDSGHHFHTNVTNKTVVINNYNTGRTQFQQQASKSQQTQKPNYGSQQGTVSRGAPQTPQTASKPNYSSGTGTIQRGSSPAPAASKPNYGSSGGISRSSPTPPSRPSYSPSSGGMSRRK
jgi:hypothetical protein